MGDDSRLRQGSNRLEEYSRSPTVWTGDFVTGVSLSMLVLHDGVRREDHVGFGQVLDVTVNAGGQKEREGELSLGKPKSSAASHNGVKQTRAMIRHHLVLKI